MRYRSTRKSVYSAKYHVIWCPKYRQRVIGGRVEARLKQIIDEVVTECGGDVIECETMPDHVHLLLELPPTVPLSALMQKPKGLARPGGCGRNFRSCAGYPRCGHPHGSSRRLVEPRSTLPAATSRTSSC